MYITYICINMYYIYTVTVHICVYAYNNIFVHIRNAVTDIVVNSFNSEKQELILINSHACVYSVFVVRARACVYYADRQEVFR